jgi:hypothetical protein
MGENFLCSFFSLLKILKSFAIKECDRQLKYQLLFMTYFIERERGCDTTSTELQLQISWGESVMDY